MVRKPHFCSCKAFRNRLKIDAKTPPQSVICWIPSWNPKKYDFGSQNVAKMDAQIFIFFPKSSKNVSYHGLWSKIPLGSLQEPAKSLPEASQEPFQGPREAPKFLQDAPCSLPSAVSEAPKRRKNPSLNSTPEGRKSAPLIDPSSATFIVDRWNP